MTYSTARRAALFFPCLVGLTGLASCGGGSSSPPPPPPPSVTSFPVASAIASFLQSAHTFNLSGSVNGVTLTAVDTFTPGPSSMFEGQATSTITQSATVTNTSTNAQISTSDTGYFIASPFAFVGDIVQSGPSQGQYTVYANQATLPATAAVGASGPLDTETTYANSSKTLPAVSTTVDTWSLSQATSSTGWWCVNSVTTPTGSTAGNSSQCYQVDASGNVLALKVITSVNGQPVTLQ
jgi:hypothetical protein